jgi:hypothetical protein
MSKSAWDPRDTHWDDFHKKRGMMTNREFFSSNGPGGFYEGMEWNGTEWVPDAAARKREIEQEQDRIKKEREEEDSWYGHNDSDSDY